MYSDCLRPTEEAPLGDRENVVQPTRLPTEYQIENVTSTKTDSFMYGLLIWELVFWETPYFHRDDKYSALGEGGVDALLLDLTRQHLAVMHRVSSMAVEEFPCMNRHGNFIHPVPVPRLDTSNLDGLVGAALQELMEDCLSIEEEHRPSMDAIVTQLLDIVSRSHGSRNGETDHVKRPVEFAQY